MEYKKIDDHKTELFLGPIPKWITTYGFLSLLSIAFFIIIFSYFFKVPKTIQVKVYFTEKAAYTSVNFNQFEELVKSNSMVQIKTPWELINGTLSIKDIWIEKEEVFIPVLMTSLVSNKISFRKEMVCQGEIIVDDASLFQKIFQRSY